jgi:ribosomal-protein-alanine N-acetyltransferase
LVDACPYLIKPLTELHAREILTWRYPHPYSFYDPPYDDRGDHYVRQFLKPELQFHSVVDRSDQFVGFCSFGIDGQVPGGDYSASALDIGLGMRPDLTGLGLGRAFVGAILGHARQAMSPEIFRLTVADFNQRAMVLYRQMGFVRSDSFIEPVQRTSYSILLRSTWI